jgi:protein O-mannosyl-transferase
MLQTSTRSPWYLWILAATFAITTAVYWSGLQGGFLFDDYPNIVDNKGVQPPDASLSSLVGAALSSPSSDFKRPLASLSFAANYLVTGIDPYWMKLTNLLIHLLNGLLVFLLARVLLLVAALRGSADARESAITKESAEWVATEVAPTTAEGPAAGGNSHGAASERTSIVAALIAAGWMLLPINLTAVLYVVQRMESMANLFVLLGLFGYVVGRCQMLAPATTSPFASRRRLRFSGFVLCIASVTVPVAIGALAKETAVMLPLYALLIEWTLFYFRKPPEIASASGQDEAKHSPNDLRIIGLFLLVLALPMVLGVAWLLPGILNPATWAVRDFTLGTRLLSETRIVVDYIAWTLLPTPAALSFYHDDFHVSTGLLAPWSTLASIVFLGALITLMLWSRKRRPLVALGIALFVGCQVLTGTILPLELIYEHRNYFASFGLMLVTVPMLAVAPSQSFALPRRVLLAGLLLCWAALTALTSYAWGNPLRLAEDLAIRAPQSPRAQYELGRTYIIYSHYDPASPFTQLAYAPLEKAAALPDASILPEQALIFMSARMQLPIKDAWWESLISKLKARKATVQDESSLAALVQCEREEHCDLSKSRMMQAFTAALAHPNPGARLLATYADFSWNILGDSDLGIRMIEDAVKAAPNEPAYVITQVRMMAAKSRRTEALEALKRLQALNYGGRLNSDISQLQAMLELK